MSARAVALLLLLALCAGAIWALGRASTERSSFTAQLSSWSAAPRGGRALFLLAQRARLQPERLQHNLEVIPERGVIVSVQPASGAASMLAALFLGLSPFTDDEVEAIGRWVEEGNTFLLIADSADELYQGFGLRLERAQGGFEEEELAERRARRRVVGQLEGRWPPPLADAWPALPALAPLDGVAQARVNAQAPEIALEDAWWRAEGAASPGPEDGYTPLLVTEEGRVVAAQVRRGAGRFVAVSAPYLASNSGLADGDNALFLLNIIDVNGEGGLYFDEYHHGFRDERGLAGYLRESGLWIVVAQLGFLLSLVGWRARRRFGAPLPWFEDEARGAGDYLKAMSQIYRRGGHGPHALEILWADLERRLAARYRLPAELSGEPLLEALARAGQPDLAARARALRGEVERARGGKKIKEEALLSAARAVSALAAEIPGRL